MQEEKLNALKKSKFRSSFHLKKKDKKYIQEKGMDEIKSHAYDFIRKRLAPKNIQNDGHQTPYKGHPVFVSMHATATCCRNCLYKWHHIKKEKELTEKEIEYVVDFILFWITKEMERKEDK